MALLSQDMMFWSQWKLGQGKGAPLSHVGWGRCGTKGQKLGSDVGFMTLTRALCSYLDHLLSLLSTDI